MSRRTVTPSEISRFPLQKSKGQRRDPQKVKRSRITRENTERRLSRGLARRRSVSKSAFILRRTSGFLSPPVHAPLPNQRRGGIHVLQGLFSCCHRRGEPRRWPIQPAVTSLGLCDEQISRPVRGIGFQPMLRYGSRTRDCQIPNLVLYL